jgi:hypothetical protein
MVLAGVCDATGECLHAPCRSIDIDPLFRKHLDEPAPDRGFDERIKWAFRMDRLKHRACHRSENDLTVWKNEGYLYFAKNCNAHCNKKPLQRLQQTMQNIN